MKILLDVDGVICDFIGGALQEINRIMWPRGKAFGRAAVTGRDMVSALGIEEHRAEIESIFRRPGFAYNLSSIEHAVSSVRGLRDAGHRIEIATAPMKNSITWISDRHCWLSECFDVKYNEIIFAHAHQKHELDADIFVDDDPDTVRRWGEAHPDSLSVLFAQPHNATERAGLVWVKDWANLMTLINEHQKVAA